MDNTSSLSHTEAHSRLQRYALNQLPDLWQWHNRKGINKTFVRL